MSVVSKGRGGGRTLVLQHAAHYSGMLCSYKLFVNTGEGKIVELLELLPHRKVVVSLPFSRRAHSSLPSGVGG